MTYTAKTFNLPELAGLSPKQIDVHLKLYAGYVTNLNLLHDQIAELEKIGKAKYAYALSELRRRLAFEFDGMRMHEYYFEQFEGPKGGDPKSVLALAAAAKYGSGENFLAHIKTISMTRGIGWVVVYYDSVGKTLHTIFVGDHELGQFAGLPIILAIDMWEHAYMVDYAPAEKAKYVDAVFANLNWSVPEQRMAKIK
jgi:Fe-Mn family superoxide dismutase